MALIQTSLIWVAYAVAVAILFLIASTFVYVYQKPRDRAAVVTIVCIFTTLALLATVLLIPVDVALVSSTSKSSLGRKKDRLASGNVLRREYTTISGDVTSLYYHTVSDTNPLFLEEKRYPVIVG